MKNVIRFTFFLAFLVGAFANKFGIGAYSDYVGPSYDEQIPLVHNLVGDEGWILLWVRNIEEANITAWQDHLYLSYVLNLTVVVRIDTDYNFINGTVSPTYRSFISQLPHPALGPLYIILGNEPNECDVNWWCNETNPNITALAQPTAAKVAKYQVALLQDLDDLPGIWLSASPLGIVGTPTCKCVWGSGLPPTQLSTDFLGWMLEAEPTLYDYVDFYSAHPYPCQTLIDGKGCIGIEQPESESVSGLTYYRQELKMIGKNLLVFISETGWDLEGEANQENKAAWTVQAYQNIYLQDPYVMGVAPFLLQTSSDLYAGFAWVAPNNTLYPQYTAIKNYRCSLEFGPC